MLAVNSGHFVILPTPAGIAFAEAWNASGPGMLGQKVSEQKALPLMEGVHFRQCRTPCLCYRHKYEVGASCTGGVDSWQDAAAAGTVWRCCHARVPLAPVHVSSGRQVPASMAHAWAA